MRQPMRRARNLIPAPQPQGSVPAPITSSDAAAMQALSLGAANEGQQRHALKWILEAACALPIWPYRETQRETDIALGRQFVGQQIMGLMKANISQLRKHEGREETEHG